LICNPGNPTGYLYSKKKFLQLAELVKNMIYFLISDEVYREFTYDGDVHYSVMSIPGLEEHAIMIDSVSKRYSMCGKDRMYHIKKIKVMEAAMKFAQARLSPYY
jgi:aspartate aminotransferase